jgi:DNA-binding NarL/FixJ family response regulator
LCVASPVLIVTDDLQWADELSLSVWRRLQALVGQLPLLLVAACRPVPPRAQVDAVRRGLVEGNGLLVRLGPLAPEHVQEMVAGLVRAAPGPGLLHRAELASGNPLYVRELVDALVRERAVLVAEGVAELIDPAGGTGLRSLPAAISGRLGFLTDDAAHVLRMAALLGREFSVEDLVALTGRTATDLLPVFDEAVAAGVLVEAGALLAFRHGLIRQALYDAMPLSLRAALHRQAAEALASAHASVERVAEQLLAAPEAVDGWVIGWVVDAAPALTYRAAQVAMDLLNLVRAAVGPEDPRREHIDAGLATALLMLARYDTVEPVARPVLAATSDPDIAGRMTWTLASALKRLARPREALEVLDTALRDKALPRGWVARARALHATVLIACGRPDEAEAAAARAHAEGEESGDRFAVGFALHARSLVRARFGADWVAQLEAIEAALAAIGREPETTDLRLLLLSNRVGCLGNMGRMAEIDRAVGEALAVAEQAGTLPSVVIARMQAAATWFAVGRWDDALTEMDAVAELPQQPAWQLYRHGLAGMIAAHRDDRAGLRLHATAVENVDLGAGDLRYHAKHHLVAQAVAAERDGDSQRALALMLSAVDTVYPAAGGSPGGQEHDWLPDVVRLALDVGDMATARGVTDAVAALNPGGDDRFLAAAARHCRGLLAGDPDLVLAAGGDLEVLRARLNRAQAFENAAVLLAQQDQVVAARAAYAEAIDTYVALDALWDIRRADARLRPLGLKRGARGPRRRPATGWAALTPSELTIAGMVAAGRSNPDIAAELFLSRRTVQTHVSHILTKLGAQSRVDIARTAISHQQTTASGDADDL